MFIIINYWNVVWNKVIELFALLVYNKNIVINRYGLNENMGKGITEREKKEREIRAENDIKKKIIYDIEEILFKMKTKRKKNMIIKIK